MRIFFGIVLSAVIWTALQAPVQAQDKSDHLPRGAIFRLGSTAFQSNRLITGLVVLPGGKQAVTADDSGLTLWDLATGARVASAAKPAEAIAPDRPRRGFGTTLPRTTAPRTTSPLRFVNQHNGSLAALPDGKSLVWWNKGGFSEPGGYSSVSLPFDGKAPRTLSSRGFGSRANLPSGIVVAAGEPFALSDRGRLTSFQQDRLGWTELRTTPPVAGDRLAIAAGGSIVAYGGEDERIRLWDAEHQRRLTPLDSGAVQALAISGDGRILAASSRGTEGKTLQVWDIASRKQLGVWNVSPAHIALSPTGKYLATASGKVVELYDVKTAKLVRRFPLTGDLISLLEFLPDERALLAAGREGCVHKLELANGPGVDRRPLSSLVAVQFLPEGGLITGGADGIVRIWNDAGKELRQLTAEIDGIEAMLLSPDGKTLFTGGSGQAHVRAWNVASGKQLRELLVDDASSLNALALNGKLLAIGVSMSGIHIVKADSFERVCVLKKAANSDLIRGGIPEAIGFAAGGRLLSRQSSEFTIWDVAKQAEIRIIKERASSPVLSVRLSRFPKLAVSPDGATFAAPYDPPRVAKGFADIPLRRNPRAQMGHSLGIWSTETGKLLDSFELPQAAPLLSIAYHPNGGLVAVGDEKGRVWLVDIATKAALRLLDGHSGPVLSLAFSPDGKRLVSGSADTTAIVWKIE